ncbi:MAG TPA: cadherin-like domain-containing protein, partial [Alphaproteobacteria bacterium]
MARTFVEGSGSGPSDHQPMHLSVNDAGSVQLPEGVNPGDLDLSRDGQNLVMTAPNGEVFVIENYFAMPDAPMILGANGALLTPNLVQSFVSSLNEIEVAAGPQVGNDASPVGEVTEVTGDATVTHTDGSKEKITVGSKIFEGDIIETDDKGAVNIQFADDSTFAVSQNARLAVDDFSFNPDDQSGSTGLSILRGVFMFTSGLVGRENPDAVHLDTPVGSIGIRGTIIGGEIDSNGKAQISVIEGAIVVRNGAGEQILSNQFETVQLTGFNAPMTNIGTLNAQSMTHSYGAVRAVAPTLFTSIDDTARDQGQPQNNNQPQHGQDAQPETQPQSQADAPQPQAEAQPQQQPAQTVLQDTPVFQTLNTGSNIDNSLGAPALHTQIGTPAPATTAAPAPSSAPAAAPAPQQSAPATSADTTTAPVRDTRPPSSLLFANDTVATNVGEDTVAGTKVAAVHQVTNLGFAVTYSLVDNAGGLFTIDANSGEVFVAAGHTTADLDGGAHGPYNIVVRTARADNPTIGTETPLTLNLVSVDEAPTFGTGGVSTTEGGTQVLSAGMIDAMDPEGQNSTLSYTFKGQQHGTLEKDSGGGFTAMTVGDTFTQADLIAGNVRFVHDGTEPALNLAKFSVTATDATGHESGVKQINVNATPVNDAPVQDTTLATPTMAERGTLSLDGSRLLWTDSDVSSSPTSIVYTLGTQNHGIVQKFVSGVWTNMSSGQTFTQADINAGNKIRFVQNDDENTTAGFAYTVTDGVIGSPIAGSFSTNVTPVNDTPELDQNNDQTVTEGQHVLITTPDLNYNDDDNLSDEVLYTVTATQNGTIEFSSDGGTTWTPGVSSFTQDDINNGRVAFKHNDSETTAASFTFTVTDGTDTAVTETHEFVVTPVNDAPTGVTLTLTTSAIDERIASGAPEIEIGTVTVSDAEGAFNPGDHDLVVQSFNGTTYVDDA